jgi:hypothetical protein
MRVYQMTDINKLRERTAEYAKLSEDGANGPKASIAEAVDAYESSEKLRSQSHQMASDLVAWQAAFDAQVGTLELAAKLLAVAKCPANCDNGVVPEQIAEDEWQPVQCQFCAERAAFVPPNAHAHRASEASPVQRVVRRLPMEKRNDG